MLYFLGGAPRAGKSVCAQQFLRETGIPFFCLDYLMMGFANGLPDYGVDPEDDELAVGAKLWPVIQAMAVAFLENKEDYLLEGVQLNPHHVATLSKQWPGQVVACFVGYADSDVEAKLAQLRRFRGHSNDWLSEYDEQQMRQTIERCKALSGRVRDECRQNGLYYCDIDPDLAQIATEVVPFLTGQRPAASGSLAKTE